MRPPALCSMPCDVALCSRDPTPDLKNSPPEMACTAIGLNEPPLQLSLAGWLAKSF